ncbi:MAG: hypothetical protein HOM11_05235 [Methylococcales bacterium]|jgi:hypothetical protein|nr:hypothetical protein [Methylococcales bacterium]MBT7445570.1 hypothetical protein [Methylococcales bacterium]
MCIKIGEDELSSVRGLMTMTLNVVIAEALELDLDDINPSDSLINTLKMTEDNMSVLLEDIEGMFDGLVVDMNDIDTVSDLLEVVVNNEFNELSA